MKRIVLLALLSSFASAQEPVSGSATIHGMVAAVVTQESVTRQAVYEAVLPGATLYDTTAADTEEESPAAPAVVEPPFIPAPNP